MEIAPITPVVHTVVKDHTIQKVNKTPHFHHRKKLWHSPLPHGIATFARGGNENHVFCNAKRRSPSPLSYGMTIFGQLDQKTAIPLQSDEGDLHFAS